MCIGLLLLRIMRQIVDGCKMVRLVSGSLTMMVGTLMFLFRQMILFLIGRLNRLLIALLLLSLRLKQEILGWSLHQFKLG